MASGSTAMLMDSSRERGSTAFLDFTGRLRRMRSKPSGCGVFMPGQRGAFCRGSNPFGARGREMAPARILAHVGPVVSLILASLPYLAVAAVWAYFLYPAIH